MAHLVITCGPASAPIDAVRRITNHSTGALGAALVASWKELGHRMTVFRGLAATAPLGLGADCVIPFLTNDDLASAIQALPERDTVDAVFHAAALGDYQVERVVAGSGAVVESKISSAHDRLTLHLVPARKLLPQLRGWFPNAKIFSWKYELNGTSKDAIAKAVAQCESGYSDWSIVNGAAFGEGFGICDKSGLIEKAATAGVLAKSLIKLF